MSKWNWGCGCKLKVFVPYGYAYKEREVECGSTAYDGGVNQCEDCEQNNPAPPAREMDDYGDDIDD